MNSTLKRITARGFLWAACIISLTMLLFTASPAVAVPTVPVLWTAGGHSAGSDSAGQAVRIATDSSGNVAVVSGPSLARDLAVTSYTASGFFRWRGAVSPSIGTLQRRLGGCCTERRFRGGWSQCHCVWKPDCDYTGSLWLRRNAPVAGGPGSHPSQHWSIARGFRRQRLPGL